MKEWTRLPNSNSVCSRIMLNLVVPKSNVSHFYQQSEEMTNEELLMPPEGYVAAAIVLFMIGFCGFFFNFAVIVLMFKEKKLWTPINVILFNLVCSDFSVSILGNPFTLISAIFRHWIFGRTMCVVYGFFMSLLGITSITTLTVLSFERYIMISRPFHTHHLTSNTSIVLIIGIWLYSAALTVPPLFGWGDYVHEAANISCSVNWEHKNDSTTTYIIFLFTFGLIVPVAIISFSYLNIMMTMKQNTLRMGRVTKAESRVAVMVLILIVAFLTAWTPYAVLALIIAFGDSSWITPGMAVIPALVAKSSICYNPLIYVGLNTQFRSALKSFFGVKTVCDASGENAGEMTMLSRTKNMSNTLDQTEVVRGSQKLSVLLQKFNRNQEKLLTKVTAEKKSKWITSVVKNDRTNRRPAFVSVPPGTFDLVDEHYDRNEAEEVKVCHVRRPIQKCTKRNSL